METNRAGETIAGRYELREVIGRGGQGVVCRARDLETDSDVAVKVMESRSARAPETVERMAREQQAMQALAGTNAVQFLDMCSADDGTLCLVMELLEGQEFEKHLVELENGGSRISVDELIAILGPIATTLDRAHSVGIVHRDLKPGNIFLISDEKGGGSRLLDFGFARLSDSKRVTNTGMVMGSPSYIAPEMWRGQGKVADHRVDVYSFGVIIFRALAGGLPFPNSSMQETLLAVTQAERPSLVERRKELPLAVDEWVKRALAVEVEERFASVRASWEYLLWALGRGPEPGHARSGWTTPPPEVDKIRQFLDEPVSQRAAPAQSVWSMARDALKRLVGRSEPVPRNAEPLKVVSPVAIKKIEAAGKDRGRKDEIEPSLSKAVPTSPPPLPPNRKKSDLPAPGPKVRRVGTVRITEARVSAADLPEVSAELLLEPDEGVSGPRSSTADLPEVSAELLLDTLPTPPRRIGPSRSPKIVVADLPEVSAELLLDDVVDSPRKGQPKTASSAEHRKKRGPNRQRQRRKSARATDESTATAQPVARRGVATAKPGTPGHVKPRGAGKPKWKSRRHRKSR